MSQISPPIRIALVAAIALIGAWMLFLRPKTETTPPVPKAPPTAPGVKGLTGDVAKAQAASKTSDAANAKIQAASGETQSGSTASGTVAGAKPAAGAAAAAASIDTSGLPARVQKALEAKKILVLFFYNPKSADDLAVKKALKKVDRWGGQVVVQAADVKNVSRYTKVAKGADVEQTPTVVVVDRNAKAERLVGYEDTLSIDQAVIDAMRASGVLIKDKYLSKINDVCRTRGTELFSIPDAHSPGAEVRTMMRTYENRAERFVSSFTAVPAPGRWKAFKKASVGELNAQMGIVHKLVRATGDGTQLAPILAVVKSDGARSVKLNKSWNARMDKHHVLSCGTNF